MSTKNSPHVTSITTAAQLADLLPATARGEWYDAHCPAHDDESPSLGFRDGPDGLIVFCRARCERSAVLAALQKQYPGFRFRLARGHGGARKQIVSIYPYQDEERLLRYETVRLEPKDFRARRPDGHGGYIWNLQGVRRILYRLPDLKTQELVWVVEGEKDADRLRALRIAATTNPGGAGQWRDEYTQQLVAQGAKLILIIPDNDDAGARHAHDVARSCLGAELDVSIIRLPDLPEKGDVSDWLDQGHTRGDLINLAREAKPVTAASLAEEPATGDEDVAEALGDALADRLVGMAETSGITPFHTPKGEPFAIVPVSDHHEVWLLTGQMFKSWLSQLIWRKEGRAARADVLVSAIQTLAARAQFEGPEEEVHLRTARFGDALYYDLADPSWRVVKITAEGWEVLETSPVRFTRYAGMAAQALPEPGGSLDDLWDVVNIPGPHHRRLLVAWLVAALLPDIPRPLLVFYGDQGSGKTTAARNLASLIDPNTAPIVGARDQAEFVQVLAHHYLPILDNLSDLREWLSNLLSRAVTGEGFSKRRLYTDDDDVIYSFRRAMILTGINLVVTKPDLLDRSLIIGTERVVDRQRREDRMLVERFMAAKPKLLGALLDLMVKAMAAYSRVTVQNPPRMADFARWGAAVSVAQGGSVADFEQDFAQNIEEQNQQAINESFTATVLLEFLEFEGKDTFEGTAENLLGYLLATAVRQNITPRDLPGTPQLLGRRLREIRPNLAAIGWYIKFSDHHHPRTITITRRRDQ
jgi:hypothetical protein